MRSIIIWTNLKQKSFIMSSLCLCDRVHVSISAQTKINLVFILFFLFSVCDDVDQVLVIQVSCYIRRECCEHLLDLWAKGKHKYSVTEWITILYIQYCRALTSSAVNLSAWVVSISVTLWRQAVMKIRLGLHLIRYHQCTRQLLTCLSVILQFLQDQRL